MPAQTFYLSKLLGIKVSQGDGSPCGRLADLVVDASTPRPKVVAVVLKSGAVRRLVELDDWVLEKAGGHHRLHCRKARETEPSGGKLVYLAKHILDKQIVDVNGKKVVRVNDLRLARVSAGMFLVAVDVGVEGLFRRIGIVKPVQRALKPFGWGLPAKYIPWDEVETINTASRDIHLSKDSTKFSTIHPSDLADIIEDLDRQSQIAIFHALDEERAADVLEEMEPVAQVDVIRNLSLAKAADVLEKMPADEVADILDDLAEEKAEEILQEMEREASEEVRELMEYPDSQVGSLMTTDYLSFTEDQKVGAVIDELRRTKPETDAIYSLFVIDRKEKLVATVSLRDLIISEPEVRLQEIMDRKFVFVRDSDGTGSLAELISKYNLLAIPVVGEDMQMKGTVIVDDVFDQLMDAG